MGRVEVRGNIKGVRNGLGEGGLLCAIRNDDLGRLRFRLGFDTPVGRNAEARPAGKGYVEPPLRYVSVVRRLASGCVCPAYLLPAFL